VAHHRFIAQFDIVLAEPGNTDTTAPTPMTDDLVQDLIKEITNKANPHDGNGKPYKVERAKKK
jgi:hypothetical protein